MKLISTSAQTWLFLLIVSGSTLFCGWRMRVPSPLTANLSRSGIDLVADRIIQSDSAGVREAIDRLGINLNQLSTWGVHPLGHAIASARADRTRTIQLLITHGADVNRPIDRLGTTPLTCAVALEDQQVADELLRAGAIPVRSEVHEGGQIDPLVDRITKR